MKPPRPKVWRRWCGFWKGKPLGPINRCASDARRWWKDVRAIEIREVVEKPKQSRKP
mgnify:CR=1 FL=1